MIFVDTSVWVDALRRTTGCAVRLSDLLDEDAVALAAPVKLEILSGVSRAKLGVFERVLRALPIYYPTRDTWVVAQRWVELAVAKGERFGVMDVLIGVIATEHGGQIWSLDGDFSRLARLRLVKTYQPRT